MQRDYTHVLEGDVLSPEDEGYQNMTPATAIARLLENPGQLKGLLNLNPEQAQNMKALSIGIGSAASVKYFGRSIGDIPAATVGSILSAIIAKKIFG